jgi:hypothetical protein
MVFVMRKIKNENLYTVKNKETGRVHAKGTTKDKAKAMIRILNKAEGLEGGEIVDKDELIWRIICKRALPL